MNARAFLEAVWSDLPGPDGPFIQVWELDRRRSSYYASSAGVTVDGERDVFTGVGLAGKRLGANHRAKATEVVAIPGFWLDLDVGPGKCPTRNDAFALSTAHASPTIVVDSGYGLHCWYLFEKPWRFRQRSEQTRAGIAAQQWVALHQRTAAQNGWHIDSVGDLARILRLPNTLNAKDPASPRPVMALGLDPANGPRYTYSQLARHLQHMPIVEPAAKLKGVHVPGDASMFFAKLEALRANSPEFEAVWTHQRAPGDGSPSAYDMSLCDLAERAMNDAELRILMQQHCAAWTDWCDEYDRGEGRRVGYSRDKRERRSYLDNTILKARSQGAKAEAAAELAALARRAA